jgi:hypothetical protein
MGGGKFGLGRISSIGELLGYRSTWAAETKQTIESELRSRGIAPPGPTDPEISAAASNRAGRPVASILVRLLLGLFVVAIAWLLYKIILG